MTNKEYDVYSEFDINKHAENFINYLEVVIDTNGKVHYAVPSHTAFLENLLRKKYGEEKFNEAVNSTPLALEDWAVFLCELTGYVLVWNDFYICGNHGLNFAQKTTLQELAKTKYTKIDSCLYRGEIKWQIKTY